MLIVAAFFVLITFPPQEPIAAAPNTCVSCHLEIGDELAVPVEKVKSDVHGKHGLSCVSCHGGDASQPDADQAMDPKKGFIRPSTRQIAAFCGKCHSDAATMKRFDPSMRVDQQSEYASSVHGKKVAQGDTKAATCISCHGNHGIVSVKDPNAPVYPTHVAETCGRCHGNAEYMKPYGIPVDQLQKYQRSVHAEALLKAGDLSAPTCNDCHGNHGAVPPGAASVANVCGTCHARQAELFSASSHRGAFEMLGSAQCLTCHSNHEITHPNDTLVGSEPPAVCITCHDRGEAGFQAANTMHQLLTILNVRIGDADAILNRAAQAGMEVSHAKFDLTAARDELTNARVLVHSVSPEALQKAAGQGLKIADDALKAGETALGEMLYRRQGLIISLGIILLAIVSIYLKIREIEGRKA